MTMGKDGGPTCPHRGEQGCGGMATKTDGGPAYPLPVNDEQCRARFESGYGGMSMRDAMALSVPMPDEIATSWAAALAGSPQPGPAATALEQIDWWARAEAAYRYRVADAMLIARGKT